MTRIPANPKIYHITHVNNLPGIVADRRIWSDAKRIERGLDTDVVGISRIKRRRLEELAVKCHEGTVVGEYVPFYFCPRSIMLYILHMANHPDLSYRGGQRPIVHLQADVMATIRWADDSGVRWAFTNRNAGAYATDFFSNVRELGEIDWRAVETNRWQEQPTRDNKQAEFLVHGSFPWDLVERVGVRDAAVEERVGEVLRGAQHRPILNSEPTWYY